MVPEGGSISNISGAQVEHDITDNMGQFGLSDIDLDEVFQVLGDWNTYLEKELPRLHEKECRQKETNPHDQINSSLQQKPQEPKL